MRSSSGGFRGAVDEIKKSRRSVVDDGARLPLKQSDMGNKRSSDVLAGAGGAAAATVPKRQSNRITLPSPLVLKTSGSNGRGGRRECDEMEIGKDTVQNYGLRNSESEAGDGASNGESLEEDGCVHHSPPGATTTASLSSQKRIRLKGKFMVNYDPVVPTVVPRKLRSGMRRPATNKLRHQSASPELSGSKKKRNLASNGSHPLLIAGCVGNSDHTMLIQPTETEMEVIEALYELGRTPVSEPVEEDKIGSEEISPAKDACVSLPKEATEEEKNPVPSPGTEARGTKEDDTKILVAPSSDETTDPTFSVEQPSEQPADAAHSVSGQTVAIPRSQIIDLESNELADSSQPFHDLKPSDGVFHQSYSGNGVLQQPKLEVLPTLKSNIKLSPSSYMPEEQKQPYGKQRPSSPAIVCREETTKDMQHGSNRGHCSVTAKAEVRPHSGAGACRANSTGKVQLAEKFPSVPADKKRLLKRCTTHVYLSYAIQSHQKLEKKLPGSNDKLKVKDGKNPGVQASNLTIGSRNGVHIIKSAENNGHPVEKNMHENRIKMFHDRRFLQPQQTSMLAGACAQQKKASDYLPLSGAGQSSNSASGLKSAGQLHVPYLQSQMLHHSSTPFPFPHGPSPYSEKPASAAADQVMFQLPPYLSNSMCGQQMVRAGGSTKQQQQMWQAQAATYYRPPQGFPKWPIDTSSLLTSAQPPPIFPPPSSHMLGRAYRPSNQPQHPQLIPRPSLSSSSTTKQHQPHDGDGGSAPEAPVELQLFSKTKC